MSDTDKKPDQEKGDEILKRMLKTPPDPKVNDSLTSSSPEKKPGGTPVKKHRPEEG
ncbi:hypothetical protein J7444_06670 [Labrenzia sp. R4_1]|uniref:hypothetical protein n=1 Tax=Labrenzia sp. R4_1 TaxID=2821106 RepID=UPI001ADCC073|nr:hypothetical protein [Labrenzia sp. R4_1]MBO9424395.1 hypothetical protein [Labrenzia sp. R4_1]